MNQPRPLPSLMESAPGPETVIGGRKYLYFGGTGYLGLAGRAEVIEAACDATRRYGIHTATSRNGFGTSPRLLEVEQLAADFFGAESAFYFVSGYVGNHILVQALSPKADAVFLDECAHFCVAEAAQLAGKPVQRFRHRDATALREALAKHLRAGQRPLVMTDGVFPSTGSLAPLREYLDVLAHYDQAKLLVDDAHGFGVLGENGRGTLEYLGLNNPPANTRPDHGTGVYVAGTLSKALGGFGGILAGSRDFMDLARASSHYYDGASAPLSAAAGASAAALKIIQREPGLRTRLQANIRQTRDGLRELGLAVDATPTANIGVAIGNAPNMQRIHAALREAGILVPYVRAYSGLGPEGLLRIAVCATHTPEMIARLLAELRRCW